MAHLRALLALSLAGGCIISTDFGDTEFLCQESPVCPDGYACVEGHCVAGSGDSPGSPDAGDEPGAALAFRRRLTFDNSLRGSLDGMPVLVLLDATRIDYAEMRPDGGDLQFVDVDGTSLPHEIEEWNPAGQSVVWVKVPSIEAGSNTDFIWMRYGDPDTVIPQDGEAVWSSYRAVYHLGAGAIVDSSAQGFDGVEVGMDAPGTESGGEPSDEPAAQIGHGRALDGASQYLHLGNERDFLRAAPGFTVEAWVNPSSYNGGTVFASATQAGSERTASGALLRLDYSLTVTVGGQTAPELPQDSVLTGGQLPSGTWSWIAGVASFSGDAMALFVNGGLVTSRSDVGFDPTSPDAPSGVTVAGVGDSLTSGFFSGQIDEVRFSAEPKSPDWMSAQYASMTDTLISYGPTED